MTDREALHARLDELLDAMERERGANSDEARSEAQGEVLALHHALLGETGLRDLMQRRCVEEMNGRAKGSSSRASELPAKARDYNSEAGRRALRAIAMRAFVDSGVLPKETESLVAAGLFAASQGREAPTGNEAGEHGGVLWQPVPIKGVSSDTTPEMMLRLKVVVALGYEAGFRGYPTTKLLPNHLLDRGFAYWKRASARLPEGTPPVRSPETLRGWCNKADTEFRARFEQAYQLGLADRAAGRRSPDLCLP